MISNRYTVIDFRKGRVVNIKYNYTVNVFRMDMVAISYNYTVIDYRKNMDEDIE